MSRWPRNSQPERLRGGNGDAGFVPVVDADEDVNDGFGGEADDRGAADVVDGFDVGGDGLEDLALAVSKAWGQAGS